MITPLSLVSGKTAIPSLDETNTRFYSPVMAKVRAKTCVIYGIMVILALLPFLARQFNLFMVPPELVACALGLLVPGGGFFALGTFRGFILGLATIWLFFTIGFKSFDLFGDVFLVPLIWLAGISGGLMANGTTPPWAPLGAGTVAIVVWTYWAGKVYLQYRYFLGIRKKRLVSFNKVVENFTALAQDHRIGDDRELDEEALRASRYLYDLCLSGKALDAFDSAFLSLECYRYQLTYAGSALLTLQCKYLPNFSGYLGEAMRTIINCYTEPKVCGYWKWENLAGYCKWDPDPVKKGNVMLSGWAASVIAAYGANTGDRRYDQEGALAFRPFKNRNKTYSYSIGDIIESFEKQILAEPSALIPCEPRLQFPICNGYAMLGMMAYDRAHGTEHTAKVYEKFIRAIMTEFCDLHGEVVTRRCRLSGLRFFPKSMLIRNNFMNINTSLVYNPIYPGLAKRSYAFIRDEMLYIEDGIGYIRNRPWKNMTNSMYAPGVLLSILELTALEFGDYEMAAALKKAESGFLVPSKKRFKYKDVGVCGMSNMAMSRWCRMNDWTDTFLKGPSENALSGPLLSFAEYPKVLVAKAISHGKDLGLVLYPETEELRTELELSRLEPGKTYYVQETGSRFSADFAGKARIVCTLKGRTPFTVIPAG
jgi:hypothetical protein